MRASRLKPQSGLERHQRPPSVGPILVVDPLRCWPQFLAPTGIALKLPSKASFPISLPHRLSPNGPPPIPSHHDNVPERAGGEEGGGGRAGVERAAPRPWRIPSAVTAEAGPTRSPPRHGRRTKLVPCLTTPARDGRRGTTPACDEGRRSLRRDRGAGIPLGNSNSRSVGQGPRRRHRHCRETIVTRRRSPPTELPKTFETVA